MNRLVVALCCVLLTAAPFSASADEMFSLKVGYQNLTASGEVAGSRNNVGTRIDIDKDMNLDDSNDITGEAAFQLGRSRLSVGYLPMTYSGAGRMTIDGTYNGQPFSASDPVQSAVELDLYDIAYTFYLLNMDDLPIRLQAGPEFAVKVVDASVAFADGLAGIDEQDSTTAAIVTLGGRARAGLADYLAVVGRVGYLEYDGNSFIDAEAQVEFSPLPLVGVYAGYRYFNVKVDQSALLVDIEFSGPFVGALARF